MTRVQTCALPIFESIEIPKKVSYIGEDVFRACQDLKEIHLQKGLKNIGSFAFSYLAVENITIPGSVEKIGTCAFYHCKQLEEVTIEEGVEQLGEGMFEGCLSLKKLTLPDSVTSVKKGIFNNEVNIEHIVIPNGTKKRFENLFPSHIGQLEIDENVQGRSEEELPIPEEKPKRRLFGIFKF